MKASILCFLPLFLFWGCASEPANPIAELQKQYAAVSEYAIILNDMKEDGNFSKGYFHRYKIVYTQDLPGKDDALPQDRQTDWKPVGEALYQQYKDSLGLVVASKQPNGQVSSAAYPPGYQYVDNPRYGHWVQGANGSSFWEFYGKYAMLSNVLGMAGSLITRNDYDSYRDYQYRRQPYYGSDNRYGTNGYHTKNQYRDFFQRKQERDAASSKGFQSKFQRRMGGFDGKTSRSSGSGFRSRSGGFGK